MYLLKISHSCFATQFLTSFWLTEVSTIRIFLMLEVVKITIHNIHGLAGHCKSSKNFSVHAVLTVVGRGAEFLSLLTSLMPCYRQVWCLPWGLLPGWHLLVHYLSDVFTVLQKKYWFWQFGNNSSLSVKLDIENLHLNPLKNWANFLARVKFWGIQDKAE